jgi:uncharacterized phage protein (TIGR02218 family)
VLTYSSADISLKYNIPGQTMTGGVIYNPVGGMRVTRDKMHMIAGTQVDELNITLFPTTTDFINNQPVPAEILNGVLDGAWVSVDRAFLSAWSSANIVGTVNVFAGNVSDCVIGRTSVKMTIKSPLELLNLNFPRNVYQPGCMHNLYDSGCTLNAASFAVNGTVGNGGGLEPPTTSTLWWAQANYAPNYFTLGYLTFTSGALQGQTRSLLYFSGPFFASNGTLGSVMTFSNPFPVAPAVGDAFTIYPGCDHQQSTCLGKFNNLVNFRGQPYIPQPETAT